MFLTDALTSIWKIVITKNSQSRLKNSGEMIYCVGFGATSIGDPP
jgi:hypothetical protein